MLPGRISSAMSSKKSTLAVPQPDTLSDDKGLYSKDELDEYRQIFSVFDTRKEYLPSLQ